MDRLLTPVFLGFPGSSHGKESTCNAEDLGSIPGLRRSPRGGHGSPLQYSCLENPVDRGAWWATVHGILQARILEWVASPFYRGIISTQGLNPGLLHFRHFLYQLSHKGRPRILEWVAYPFSSGLSPNQESNQGLLHYRWMLNQLSYQGSPDFYATLLELFMFLLGQRKKH